MDAYEQFIASKSIVAPTVGFDVDRDALNPAMFDFQKDVVQWALRRGRAALFLECGLGKTITSLDWSRHVAEHTQGRVLVLAPLAVAPQTVREGEKFGIAAQYARSPDDVSPDTTIVVTNYEMLDRFDPDEFAGVVLDESSILKAYDGKTRTQIIEAFRQTPFRLAATATPAPNDFMELGNHTEFLGIMTRAEMLATFFVHDGGETQTWRIKGHAESDFWRWVCSWAAMVRKPSDLGYDDGPFTLPAMTYHEHVVPVDHSDARKAGMLFAFDALTLADQRATRRASLDKRVQVCADMVNAAGDEQWIVWCELNDEGDALERAINGAVQVKGSDSNEDKESRAAAFQRGEIRVMVSKPSIFGWGMNFQSCARNAFVGVTHSFEATYQAIRRTWRFGQKRPVETHVIRAETEGAIVANLRRKEADALRMADAMAEHMRDLQRASIRGSGREWTPYEPKTPMRLPDWLRSEPDYIEPTPTEIR